MVKQTRLIKLPERIKEGEISSLQNKAIVSAEAINGASKLQLGSVLATAQNNLLIKEALVASHENPPSKCGLTLYY